VRAHAVLHGAAALGVVLLALALPVHGAEELRAGYGVAPLPSALGAPLGGYGGLRDREARSIHDAPEARALVLELGDRRLAVVSLDVVIPRGELRAELLREAGPLDLDGVLLAATHTHSGPGGYIEGWLAARITAGSFDAQIRTGIVQAALAALRGAAGDLRAATLATGQIEIDLAVNRRQRDGARERALPMLELARAGASRIVLFAYGAHATTLSVRSHAYSADYIAPARGWLEAHGVKALFLAGPLGDQGPRPALEPVRAGEDAELAWAREIGEALGRAVWEALPSLRPSAPALELQEQEYPLQAFQPRRFCALWWLGPLVGGAARRIFPERAPLQAWTIGAARLLAIPAEPTSELGSDLRAAIRERFPEATPFVVAHANEWTGYALTAAGYRRGGYESCLSFQGPEFGSELVARSRLALERLADAP
jgi:neutral ceramidase